MDAGFFGGNRGSSSSAALLSQDRGASKSFTHWMHTGEVCGMDLDDSCAYTTPKMVVIRDWKLGIFNRLCTLGIAVYIGVFVLYLDKGYLKQVPVDGSGIRSTVFATPPTTLPAYCCDCSLVDGEASEPLIQPDLPDVGYHYCYSSGPLATRRPAACCALPDLEGIRAVTTRQGSLAIATNWNMETLTPSCGEAGAFPVGPSPQCYNGEGGTEELVTSDQSQNYYAMNVEEYTLSVSHAISSSQIRQVISLSTMDGKLLDQNGNVVKTWPNDSPVGSVPQDASRTMDIFTIAELLQACGLEEEGLDGPDVDGNGRSLRDSGFQILMYIEYKQVGADPSAKGSVKYQYRPRAIREVKYKEKREVSAAPLPTEGGVFATRSIEVHGINILFIQSGTLGEISLQQILTSLVTSYALLAAASFITEWTMCNLMQLRGYYNDAKFETSIDFTEVRSKVAALLAVQEQEQEQEKQQFHFQADADPAEGGNFSWGAGSGINNGGGGGRSSAMGCPEKQVIARTTTPGMGIFQKAPHEPSLTPYELTQKVQQLERRLDDSAAAMMAAAVFSQPPSSHSHEGVPPVGQIGMQGHSYDERASRSSSRSLLAGPAPDTGRI